MSGTRQQETARERLARLMDERREQLGKFWNQVAEDADLTKEGLRTVRSGEGKMRAPTKRGIERALAWETGSVDRILEGGDPTPLKAAWPTTAPVRPDFTLVADDGTQVLVELKRHGVNPQDMREQVARLRAAAEAAGVTVGHVLVVAGIAQAEELILEGPKPSGLADAVIKELEEDPSIPSEVKEKMLQGFHHLYREVAESLKKP